MQDSNKCCLHDLWCTGIWDKSCAISFKVWLTGEKNLLQTNHHCVRYLPKLTYYIYFFGMLYLNIKVIYLHILSGNFRVKFLSINLSLVNLLKNHFVLPQCQNSQSGFVHSLPDKNLARIAKSCTKNISLVVKVSSCFYKMMSLLLLSLLLL